MSLKIIISDLKQSYLGIISYYILFFVICSFYCYFYIFIILNNVILSFWNLFSLILFFFLTYNSLLFFYYIKDNIPKFVQINFYRCINIRAWFFRTIRTAAFTAYCLSISFTISYFYLAVSFFQFYYIFINQINQSNYIMQCMIDKIPVFIISLRKM